MHISTVNAPLNINKTTHHEGLNLISYSQSQTENGGSVVKVVDHFIVGCVVHFYMPERQKEALR